MRASPGADRAIGVAREPYAVDRQCSRVNEEKLPNCGHSKAARKLEGFSRLHRADDAGEWCKYAHHGATNLLDTFVFRENAVIAGRVGCPRIKHAQLPIKADGCA